MKIKDVTRSRQNEVKMMKMYSPKKSSEIKIYESGPTRFIHEIGDGEQLLSISCSGRSVIEKEWIPGIKEIMQLEIEDVEINIRPSGVVIISEKDESIPKTANNYH
ncbi:hypothetical protein [Virgibacillus siamensis]|uniref:hypothetical protein n=1 Tax=Virgibacillus siamensis TaxID=480071 RepID=UPI000984EBE4|nr:hypothetical protein [Virgibacillus siamensis]